MADADVVVIGLGAMGSATADVLAGRGVRVLGIEAFGAGHANGSSHGPTRIIRRAIEEGPAYVPIVLDALERWADLQAGAATQLVALDGAIRVAPRDAPLLAAMRASAAAHGLPYEELSAADVRARFPAFHLPDDHIALFELGAGVVFADRAVHALQARATARGATLRYDEPVRSWRTDGDGVAVTTDQGTYRADRLVVAGGAWTTRLLAELALPLVPMRVVNASFEPADRARHGLGALPAFIVSDGDDGIYGVPAVPGEGVKVGHEGTPTDPDDVDRTVRPEEVAALRGWLERYLPGAAGPVTSTLTCLYTQAPDGDFVLGIHPGHPQVVVASPCSGHGFKYTPAIGALLADLATGVAPRVDVAPFAVDRFRWH